MSSTSLDRTIADERGTYLLTRSGTDLRLRPVTPTDGPLLGEFFARLSPDDLRFRFLDTRKLPMAAEIGAMVEVDHRRSEHVLAFDTCTGQLIASLMIVADRKMETAEVAIAVASEWKGRGGRLGAAAARFGAGSRPRVEEAPLHREQGQPRCRGGGAVAWVPCARNRR